MLVFLLLIFSHLLYFILVVVKSLIIYTHAYMRFPSVCITLHIIFKASINLIVK